jgi:hypothetical protein
MAMKSAEWDPKQTQKLDDLIQTSFSDFVRRERRNLILAASISLFVCASKAVPTEASLLIFKIEKLSPRHTYAFLLVICIYTALGFWLYALPEFRKAVTEWNSDSKKHKLSIDGNQALWQIHRDNLATAFRYRTWVSFEYMFPIFLSAAAILFLIFRLFHPA